MNYFETLIRKAYTIRDDESAPSTERELAAALVNLNQEYKIVSSEFELLKMQLERERK